MRNYWLIFCLLLFISCEKVVEVPLDEADVLLVVEAVMKDRDSSSFVKISSTSTVYTESNFPTVSGAIVNVTDNLGESFLFYEQSQTPGLYVNNDFKLKANRTYFLNVQSNGEVVSAEATTRSKPKIDSVTYTQEQFGFGDENFETYLVAYHSVDNPNEENYYRLRIWINEEEVGFYYLGDDKFINGQNYEAQFFGSAPELGDSIRIEMLEMDKTNYKYQVGLSEQAAGGGPFSAAPSNPPTNIVGNAIGYFGVYMTDTASIVIE